MYQHHRPTNHLSKYVQFVVVFVFFISTVHSQTAYRETDSSEFSDSLTQSLVSALKNEARKDTSKAFLSILKNSKIDEWVKAEKAAGKGISVFVPSDDAFSVLEKALVIADPDDYKDKIRGYFAQGKWTKEAMQKELTSTVTEFAIRPFGCSSNDCALKVQKEGEHFHVNGDAEIGEEVIVGTDLVIQYLDDEVGVLFSHAFRWVKLSTYFMIMLFSWCAQLFFAISQRK